MSAWPRVPFDAVVTDVSAGNTKTPQSEVHRSGRYPVVDQGKELITGYVDDDKRLCQAELPVIVFGDHTRCFKYVDFPFCVGADGVKVLRPKGSADTKYLFHYLRQLNLVEGGYDRHFKYLKRSSIVLPPLAEQRRIAEVLDRAEALRAKRRAALAQLDTLTQSIFLDMFGDPATNPKRWPVSSIGSLLREPPNYGTMIPASSEKREWLALRVANIQNWTLDLNDEKYVDLPTTEHARHAVADGDILLARAIASEEHLGKAIVAHPQGRQWAFDSHLMRLRFDQRSIEPEFVRELLRTAGGRRLFLKSARRSAVQFNINTKEISALEIPIPPASLQRDFHTRIAAVERMKAVQRAALAALDALFASLQHRAFRGEL